MATTQPSASATAPDFGQASRKVLTHHLGAFAQGIDAILVDYTEQSVLITADKTYRGIDEIRAFFTTFMDSATKEFWDAFVLGAQKIEGEIAYITWWSRPSVALATDTLLIRDGKIAVQTFTLFAT